MANRAVLNLIVAVIVGASLGYTLAYVISQPAMGRLGSELTAVKQDLNAKRLSLSAREAERQSARNVRDLLQVGKRVAGAG